MPITSEEVSQIPGITKAGTYTLNGEQALAYSRIRHATGGDYKRTERMRNVLTATVNKVKSLNISKLNGFVDTILPKVYTNVTSSEIFSMMPSIANYKITDSIGWPYKTNLITMYRWYGIPIRLESYVTQLHKEAFGETDYVPSDTIKDISNKIIEKTGYSK